MRRPAGAFSQFAQFGVVPKTNKVREPRIPDDDWAAKKKKNDI
jgi:hypothetical protein